MSENGTGLMDYAGKVCVVTGSASGIGRSVCEMLIAQGAVVYGLDRNEYLPEGMAQFIPTDLADKASIDHAFSLLPARIHCFFGVAGLSGAKTDWWTTFTVNFSANKYITEAYLEKRMEAGDAIAYVTSTGGLMWEKWQKEYRAVMDCSTWEEMTAFMKKVAPKNGVGIMAYSLSKRAMNYYTNKKAVELAPRGIRVNAVLPGSTDTGMKQEFEKMAGGKEALLRENGTAGRLAFPAEMAEPLLFLNSPMARFVSGQLLIVDMANNCQIVLGYKKSRLNVPVALKLYNTKFFQKQLQKQI
ncbi:SDR family oxidoreductase [Candidatus Allofournierella excrementavium]|uniref:SDR family oxidoreductase n=1 Tax=Candidatus Allofournierella excrementavium TaxID=2838591 RepID=UPI00374EFED3